MLSSLALCRLAMADEAGTASASNGAVATSGADSATAASAERAATTAESRAETAYDQALAAYAAGEKARALELMSGAYALAPHPELLFNLARLRRELGQCAASLDAYRRYLAGPTDEPSREAATRAARDLDAECGTPPPAPSYWTTQRMLGWSLIGGGVVAGTFATYFGVASGAAHTDVERAISDAASTGRPYQGHSAEQNESRDVALGAAFAATAGTLVVGGVLLLVLGSHGDTRERPSVALGAGPGSAYLGLSQRF
ncbi:MAG TPA: hypothetical protein VH062_14060 [Polyangiaceae bacterium]|nr:hypothetical protein [Polyangiaceae bacterium]